MFNQILFPLSLLSRYLALIFAIRIRLCLYAGKIEMVLAFGYFMKFSQDVNYSKSSELLITMKIVFEMTSSCCSNKLESTIKKLSFYFLWSRMR